MEEEVTTKLAHLRERLARLEAAEAERAQAETALRESEARNRALLSALPDLMFVASKDGIYLDYHAADPRLLSAPPERFMGKAVWEVLPQDVADRYLALYEQALRTNEPQIMDYALDLPIGTRHFEGRVVAYGPDKTLTIVRDITERKQAEAELAEQRNLLETILEQAADGIMVCDGQGNITFANAAARRLAMQDPVGTTIAQIPTVWGKAYSSEGRLLSVEERPLPLALRGETIRGRELRLVHSDGTSRHSLVSATPLRNPDGEIIGAVSNLADITEHKRAEAALRESEETARVLINALPDAALVLLDSQGTILAVNEAAAQTVGKRPEELLDSHVSVLLPEGVPQSNPAHAEALRAGKPLHLEEEYQGRIMAHNIYPVLDAQGKLVKQAILVRDITEQRRMEQELLKAHKLESLGVLAGGIAHEFNNILTAILGNLSFARMLIGTERQESVFELLKGAERASLRAKDLTQQLLTFAKGGVPVKKSGSVADLLRESVNLALRGSKVGCKFSFDADLWAVDMDEGQINQVIQNLVLNADQAMPAGGTLWVSAENVTLEQGGAVPLPPGRYVRVAVRDDGVGISPEHLSRIFDPFFTTKQKGSGLGLAASYSIIHKHHGHLQVESEMGVGTTFTFFLPASPEAVLPQEEAIRKAVPGHGKILVMDDEDMIRDFLYDVLTRLQYEVVAAEDGAEAIALYEEAQEASQPFDAVILDLTVPGGMGGLEAIQKLREIDPHVRAIVSSGYSTDPVMAEYKKHGFRAVLAKPYDIELLSHTLKETIVGATLGIIDLR